MVVEGVIHAGIDVNPHLWPRREVFGYRVYGVLRHEPIFAGEVHEHGAADAAGFVQCLLDADAVERDRRIDIVPRGGEVGELAAEAEAHGSHLAGALRPRPQRFDRGADIRDTLVHVEALVELEGLGEVGLVVAEVHAGLHPPEEIGHEADIAFLGVEVGDRPQARVDPENLLLDEQARPAARLRHRQITPELAAAGGRNIDHRTCHERLSASLARPASAHSILRPPRSRRNARDRTPAPDCRQGILDRL